MKKLITSTVLLLIALQAFCQGMISGKVQETSGEPVIGATVYYEGTEIRAVTNAKGEYSIKALPGKTLVFSCFGLKDEKLTVGAQSVVNVTLSSDSMFLEDAVVIGYGSQQRQDLTGSVASVKADEIRKANQMDVLGSLQGHVAGLNITNQSGEPGAGYSIRIRGNNSINAATTPLIVIDGMQMDISGDEGAVSELSLSTNDPLAFLNPVDIQSVEVLKDASATAIYGARGANGVILITTKSGAENAGKTAVTFDANFGITTPARKLDMLNAEDWLSYRFENACLMMDNRQKDYFGMDTDGDGVPDVHKPLSAFGRPAVNWQDEMLRNAFSQQYNLSFRTSVGKDTRILTSLGYLNQEGMIVSNGYNKFTAKMKIDHSIGSKVKVGANVNFARTKSTGAATSSGGSFTSYGLTQLIFLEKPIDKFYDATDPSTYFGSLTSLYDCISSETSRVGTSNKLMGNAYLEWNIIPDLKFRAYASGDLSTAYNNEFFSERTRWGHYANGVANVSNTLSTGITANATLTYKHTWNKKHNFDAVAGTEINDYAYQSYSQQVQDFEDDSLRDQVLGKGRKILNPEQRRNSNARISAFGRANYNYDWRYYLTVNLRCDSSSKFAAGSRVGVFPSVSAAWRLSNEPWMRDIKHRWMDNFKIRLSAGTSGNDRITNYAFLSTMDAIYYADGLGNEILGMADYSAGNPRLKWETTYQYDAGLDLTLFKGRVDFTFDVYDKETYDMLFLATVPAQSGYTNQWQNIGQVQNRGLEFSLNTVNIKRRDFTWSSNVTFDLNRNKVINLGEGVDMKPNNIAKGQFKEEPTRLMVGQPIGIIWGYEWDGNYQLDDFDIYYNKSNVPVDKELVCTENYNDFVYKLKDGVTKMNGADVMPGDRKLKDLDGDGIIKEDDKKKIGKCDPDFTYGIGNTLTWRGFSFYVFFDGVYGKDILNEFKYNVIPGGTIVYNNMLKDAYYNAWRPETGSNKHARINNQNNTQSPLSTYFVEDGSYFRLKTLSLSYNLPSKLCHAVRMDGIKVSLNVNNVYTWTNYSGLDPDMSSRYSTFPGIDRMGYPTGRTWSLGLIANF